MDSELSRRLPKALVHAFALGLCLSYIANFRTFTCKDCSGIKFRHLPPEIAEAEIS